VGQIEIMGIVLVWRLYIGYELSHTEKFKELSTLEINEYTYACVKMI